MAVIINGKPYDLARLRDELIAAGVTVRGGIGSTDTGVHTYDPNGSIAAFPNGQRAIVESVMAAHVAEALPDYDGDAAQLDTATVRAWVQASRAYLATASPTAAETVAQTKRNTRALLAWLRTVTG